MAIEMRHTAKSILFTLRFVNQRKTAGNKDSANRESLFNLLLLGNSITTPTMVNALTIIHRRGFETIWATVTVTVIVGE
jgi:hypothetical protein